MAAQSRKIIVGFDGSQAAVRALEAAVQLTGYGSSLTVVNVAESGERPGPALADARARVRSRHVTATYVQRLGDPAGELLDAAREVEAGLVVVGRRAERLTRQPPGSVSATIVQRAPCDVLVVS